MNEMDKIFEKEELENRINQAMMWLGFEDVEFEKTFSAEDFEQGKTGEKVFKTSITYSNTDGLIPKQIATSLVKILEEIIDYHIKSKDIKLDIKRKKEEKLQREKIEIEREKLEKQLKGDTNA